MLQRLLIGLAKHSVFKSTSNSYEDILSYSLDSNDQPVLWWYKSGDIYLRRWTGAGWAAYVDSGGQSSREDDGISPPDSFSYSPTIASDSSGPPMGAWEQRAGDQYQISARRWDGQNWREMALLGHGRRHLRQYRQLSQSGAETAQ